MTINEAVELTPDQVLLKINELEAIVRSQSNKISEQKQNISTLQEEAKGWSDLVETYKGRVDHMSSYTEILQAEMRRKDFLIKAGTNYIFALMEEKQNEG